MGHFRLEGIRPAPRGVPQIDVTFDIDANGILTVAAKDKETGKEQKITISGSTQLSKEEIDQMVKDAQAHADEDKRRREEVEVRRNTADSTAYQVERQIRELGERVPANEKARAEQTINQIRAQLKNDSRRSSQAPATHERSPADCTLAHFRRLHPNNGSGRGGRWRWDEWWASDGRGGCHRRRLQGDQVSRLCATARPPDMEATQNDGGTATGSDSPALERLKEQLRQEHEMYLRALADFENYRKRVESDRTSAAQRGKRGIILSLLELADGFELALQHLGEAPSSLAEGLKAIYRRLQNS